MKIEDHILALVAKKLASEASEDELVELNELLQRHPDIGKNTMLITEWWQSHDEQSDDANDYFRFQKIVQQIKDRSKEE